MGPELLLISVGAVFLIFYAIHCCNRRQQNQKLQELLKEILHDNRIVSHRHYNFDADTNKQQFSIHSPHSANSYIIDDVNPHIIVDSFEVKRKTQNIKLLSVKLIKILKNGD